MQEEVTEGVGLALSTYGMGVISEHRHGIQQCKGQEDIGAGMDVQDLENIILNH